jgi:hypothetical protein
MKFAHSGAMPASEGRISFQSADEEQYAPEEDVRGVVDVGRLADGPRGGHEPGPDYPSREIWKLVGTVPSEQAESGERKKIQ